MARGRPGGQSESVDDAGANPYGTGAEDAPLRLVRSAVLYVDVLGVREMTQSDPQANLERFGVAISRSYRNFSFADSPWPWASFSDMLVLCAPIGDAERAAVEGLVFQAAYLQSALGEHGFFLRGGLTVGDFHISDDVVFGPALVAAVEIEERVAVSPRIVLDATADEIMRGATAAARALLRRDGDGHAFVHHLGAIADDPADASAAFARHRDTVVACLESHRHSKRQWEKYRWTAEYHNSVVASVLPGRPELAVPAETMTWRFDGFA